MPHMSLHDGLRVLEVSEGPAAAFCGKLFARWGADVVALRDPASALRDSGAGASSEALSLFLDGGKRVLALAGSEAERSATIAGFATASDLVITDVAPANFDAWRTSVEAAGARPRVLTSITPFGLSGPYRDHLATSATLLALGGYSFLIGEPDGAPLTMPGLYAYYQAGQMAYTATLASYLSLSPDPAFVEVSVFETLVSLHQSTTVQYTYGGKVRRRNGNRWANIHPNTILPCKDGWLGVCITPNFWEQFTYFLGRPDLQTDPRFSTPPARVTHADELDEIILPLFAHRTNRELLTEGQESFRVPIGSVATVPDVLDDEQLEARGFWSSVARPDGSLLRTTRSPFRFDAEPPPDEQPAPATPEAGATGATAGWRRPAPASRPASWRDRSPTGRSAPAGPLNGVRVIDLTRVWAGPLATRILADLGADVIKVEAPTGRGAATPAAGVGRALGGSGDRPWNQQGSFNKLSRNKRSLAIDLKSAEGRELFLRLVAESDVVIENFSARAMERLGLGYERLRAANESIIYVGMPGFGRSGPYRDYVALGPSIEPMTGLASLMGYGDGTPRVTSKAVPDAIGGTHGAAAVVSALQRRARTGTGCAVDLSQHEASVELLGEYFVDYQLTGRTPAVVGNGHAEWSPHGTYPCAGEDHWIVIAARDEAEWRALSALAARGWTEDQRFATAKVRREHTEAIDEAIGGWTRGFAAVELMSRLQAAGVPAGAVLSAPEMLADPHLRARGFFVTLDQPDVGEIVYPGTPVQFDGRRRSDWVPAPTLGQHNAEVLGGLLGLTDGEIDALHESGVLANRPPV